jgi:hypothetical protein
VSSAGLRSRGFALCGTVTAPSGGRHHRANRNTFVQCQFRAVSPNKNSCEEKHRAFGIEEGPDPKTDEVNSFGNSLLVS